MRGFAKVLEGIVKYSLNDKKQALFQLKMAGNNPSPIALMFSCMDSRVISSRYTKSEIGENYVVKNAGNFVPYPGDLTSQSNSTAAAAALELTCMRNNMCHVIVTGHSDCKAMQLLYSIRNEINNKTGTPLELWVKEHGTRTLQKFSTLTKENEFRGPVVLKEESEEKTFHIEIDRNDEYAITDKLSMICNMDVLRSVLAICGGHVGVSFGKALQSRSTGETQVNCIQQIENIAAYPFLFEKLSSNNLFLHALWYDIHSAKVFIMSRKQKQFVEINEDTYFTLMTEIQAMEEDVTN